MMWNSIPLLLSIQKMLWGGTRLGGPCWSLMFHQHCQRVTLTSSFIYFFPRVGNAIIVSGWDLHRIIKLHSKTFWRSWIRNSFTQSLINYYICIHVQVQIHLSCIFSTKTYINMVTLFYTGYFHYTEKIWF